MRSRMSMLALAGAALAIAPMLAAEPLRAAEPALASAWVKDHNSRARLIAGGSNEGVPAGTIAVGVEIELAKEWKTYWRNPGSSGVPPMLTWAPSKNLSSAETYYPAPLRLAEREGDTIGYKDRVIFPVAVRATDPAKPVDLVLEIEYGVCKDICIPVQSRIELTLPPGIAAKPIATTLKQAFDAVPRAAKDRRTSDPRLRTAKVLLGGDKPSIRLEAEFPGGTDGADLFLEAPDNLWIPMPKRDGNSSGDAATFVVDLTDGADVGDLKGKTIAVTMVSPRGQSHTSFKFE